MNCFMRDCKHYETMSKKGDKYTFYCPAFPNGIPDSISYGDEKHYTIYPGQVGNIVYQLSEEVEDV